MRCVGLAVDAELGQSGSFPTPRCPPEQRLSANQTAVAPPPPEPHHLSGCIVSVWFESSAIPLGGGRKRKKEFLNVCFKDFIMRIPGVWLLLFVVCPSALILQDFHQKKKKKKRDFLCSEFNTLGWQHSSLQPNRNKLFDFIQT